MLSHPDPHRPISCNTLYRRHRNSIFFSRSHLPRRKLRMTDSKYTCQRSLLFLHLHLSTHWTRPLLRVLLKQRNMKCRGHPTPLSHNNCLRRLRPSLRTNIFLRSHCYYKLIVSLSLHWRHTSPMNLRRFFCRQRDPNTILCFPLFIPLCHRGYNLGPPNLPPRNRIQQPYWTKLRRRQNFLPPILFLQRPPRLRHFIDRTYILGTFYTKSARRPGQFYPSKSFSHPATH